MKHASAALMVATLTLSLASCGAQSSEETNRTATGTDAEYIQELIDLDPAFADQADSDLLGMAEDFCYILDGTKTPTKAMGSLYSSMDSHVADMYAIHTVSEYCSNNLFSLTDWLGYK